MDYRSATGHCVQGSWQCGTQLCRHWLVVLTACRTAGLKPTLFPCLPCFPWVYFKQVVRRQSTLGCVQELEAESTSPIVLERSCLEFVRKLMQGDCYIGRGSRGPAFSETRSKWQYTDELEPYDATRTCCARATSC